MQANSWASFLDIMGGKEAVKSCQEQSVREEQHQSVPLGEETSTGWEQSTGCVWVSCGCCKKEHKVDDSKQRFLVSQFRRREVQMHGADCVVFFWRF